MKKILLLCLSVLIYNCSSDDANETECNELHAQYIKALGYTNGNPAAVKEINREYNERKKRLGCN